jgi:PAS domain S-box-containing protein
MMNFVIEKDDGPIPFILSQILDASFTGITLSDPDLPDNPIIYANAAFEELTGYPVKSVIGHNCRFLHLKDRDQPGLEEIRNAILQKRSATVMLRNYKLDGTLFHNRFTIKPILDREGRVIYYLGIQHDVSKDFIFPETVSD